MAGPHRARCRAAPGGPDEPHRAVPRQAGVPDAGPDLAGNGALGAIPHGGGPFDPLADRRQHTGPLNTGPLNTGPLNTGPIPVLPGTPRPTQARLNPKYTFDTFVIGSSNRFAHAAAVAVAEAPAKAYNPLFIYGDSGLGKTHLLHAIGHYAQRLSPRVKVRYVTSEEFINDFINIIRDASRTGSAAATATFNVLLIDDIQFLETSRAHQEEFFHTFNTLHNASNRSSSVRDRSPRRLVDPRGPAADAVRVGPDHRRAAAGPGDPDRDPAQEGGTRG